MPTVRTLALGGLAVAATLKLAMLVVPAAHDSLLLMGAAEAAGPSAAPLSLDVSPAEAAVTPDSQMCAAPDAIAQAIADERALLSAQRDRLDERAAEVALSEESLRAERERLTGLRDQIETQLQKVEAAYGQDLSKLVALYRNMKPQVAAGIMDEMDLEVAVLVLGAMPERDAAQILGQLSLVRARAISKIILERSKLPGDQDLNGLKLR